MQLIKFMSKFLNLEAVTTFFNKLFNLEGELGDMRTTILSFALQYLGTHNHRNFSLEHFSHRCKHHRQGS